MPSGFALVFLCLSKFLLPEKSANARKSDAIFLYCVAGRLTQIAVGNYGFISLAPLRLVFSKFLLYKNIVSIWRYAFMEMMNNAIEHSSAESIAITLSL